jgi:hypothetical protein
MSEVACFRIIPAPVTEGRKITKDAKRKYGIGLGND